MFERPLWLSLALVALNLFVYASVRHFQLVNWDDPTYITENPNLGAGLTWHSITWALTTGYSPYWHPMTWLSYLAEIQLFGVDAGVFHVTNVVLHVTSTVLLFGLLRRMTGAVGRSAFVAAIFAVHPLHVESVAWVAERKDVLSTCSLLLTMWAYVAYVRRPQWPRYAGVLALFALALMSKPMVVTLPVVLLLLDIWPLGRLDVGGPDPPLLTRRRPGVAVTETDGSAKADGPRHGARVTWRRAIVEKLPLPRAHDERGDGRRPDACRRRGRPRGMAQYTEALRLKPDLPTAHFNLALLLVKRGNVSDARRHLETALTIDPAYEPARRALAAITSR